jgi:hypothetical protein
VRPVRTEHAEDHRPQHRRQRIDGADGEIDAAGDDHERRPDGHDREEARVLGELGEVLRVEELVFLDEHGRAFAVRPGGEDPHPFALLVHFEHRHLHRAAKKSEQRAKQKDDNDQPALLKAPAGGAWFGRD